MKAVVLDQFGVPWGICNTDEKNGAKINVFCQKTIDGTPVNVKTYKISRDKIHMEYLERHSVDYKILMPYVFNSKIFYQFI
jgi:hypothetical protein